MRKDAASVLWQCGLDLPSEVSGCLRCCVTQLVELPCLRGRCRSNRVSFVCRGPAALLRVKPDLCALAAPCTPAPLGSLMPARRHRARLTHHMHGCCSEGCDHFVRHALNGKCVIRLLGRRHPTTKQPTECPSILVVYAHIWCYSTITIRMHAPSLMVARTSASVRPSNSRLTSWTNCISKEHVHLLSYVRCHPFAYCKLT